MSYDYVWGLFDEAVRTLVKSPEVTALRLRHAYLNSLIRIEESDLDKDLLVRFQDLSHCLTKHHGLDGVGAVDETTSRTRQRRLPIRYCRSTLN